MFTGLVTGIGQILYAEDLMGDCRVFVAPEHGAVPDTLSLGDSISVSGVCLTVTSLERFQEKSGFWADLSQETLRCSRFSKECLHSFVNLERPLLPSARLDGHFVSGHVDDVATVITREQEGRSQCFTLTLPEALSLYVVAKGSVSLEGISLTVNAVEGLYFTVNCIPHTVQSTTVQHWSVGTRLNIEVDLIARHIERLLPPVS